jgi:hypothetical protein
MAAVLALSLRDWLLSDCKIALSVEAQNVLDAARLR